MKKVILSSNLLLRFYAEDGWSIEELNSFCTPGEAGGAVCPHPKDSNPYFIYEACSPVDVDKLLERCSKLVRAFNDYPAQTDREFMERHI
jgi:hypothetical protein